MVSPSSGFGMQVPELQQALTAYQDGVQQMGVHADDIGQLHAPASSYGTHQQDWAQIDQALSSICDAWKWVGARLSDGARHFDDFSKTIQQQEDQFRQQRLRELDQQRSQWDQSDQGDPAHLFEQRDNEEAGRFSRLLGTQPQRETTAPVTPPVLRSPNG